MVEKNPTLALSRRTFDVLDTFLFFCLFVCLFGVLLLLGFFFLNLFSGGVFWGKFLKMEASSKPPQPHPKLHQGPCRWMGSGLYVGKGMGFKVIQTLRLSLSKGWMGCDCVSCLLCDLTFWSVGC